MAKRKTSGKQKPSYRVWSGDDFKRELSDPKLFAQTVVYALEENDMEALRDALITFFNYIADMDAFSKKTGVAKRTLYGLLDPKRNFNPTVRTLGAIMEAARKAA